MAEPNRFPPSNSGWPTQQAPLNPPVLQHTPQQQSHKFQALRDWNWFHSAVTSPWAPTPMYPVSSCSGPGYVQHHSSGFYLHGYPYRRQDHGQNQWRNKKKTKESEFSHFCDACDRGFKNDDAYNEHIAQHVKCSVDDCKYTAHEKLVKIHWRNSHAPGAKRIKLDTPEEIAKWREERRRNYPTRSNIEKKIKLMEVKEKRGDVLETSQFGRFKSGGRVHGGHHHGKGFQVPRGHAYGGHQHFHPGSEKVEQASPLSCPAHDVDPLGALAISDPDHEKEESVKEMKAAISVAPKIMTSALGSLISSYGEDISESDQEPEDAPVLKSSLALEENKALLAAHSNPNQNSAPKPERWPITEKSNKTHQVPRSQSESHSPRSRGHCGGRQRQRNKPRTGPQKCHPTLLEMLLAPDIRHERNVVLQCIRYIIHKDFFGLACNDSNLVMPDDTSVTVNGSVSGNDVGESRLTT
ncbi:nuclear fragile X mental retardation-interacting protein 1 isoform X2 [Neoarius graeffei]|uniref:nuclear fragile X mental retardation-interacting protein 1 isoform X2 n=1 Tax=Neoarius graeffei TaxID=443677 RepID=UPI00298CE3A9|nr:nuclear fragile X mental retardation-interacting protein 1 isoform X2 [Neoarius graeffei]